MPEENRKVGLVPVAMNSDLGKMDCHRTGEELPH